MPSILAIHASDAEQILDGFRTAFDADTISFLNVENKSSSRLRSELFEASRDADICLIFSSDLLVHNLETLANPRASWLNQYVLARRETLSIQLNIERRSRPVRVLYRDLFHAVRVWPGKPLLLMNQQELSDYARKLRFEFDRPSFSTSSRDWFDDALLFEIERNVAMSPPPKDDPRIVELLFATNRAPTSEPATRDFGADRADVLSYGACRVRIPEDHKIGHLELPKKAHWLRLRFWDEEVDEERHFVLKDIGTFDRRKFCDLVQGDDSKTALVFVHGFNTTFKDGVLRLSQIVWDMQFKGAPILFSWPSAGGVLNYLYDLNSALGARPRFQELIQMLRADAGVTTIHIVAHSMGNMVVLDSLNELVKAGSLPNLAEIVMAAPDVDIDLYKAFAANIRPLTRGMTLYASANDKALVASRKAAGKQRAGDVFSGSPILLPNIESIDVSAVGDEMFGLNHSVFADNRSLIDDIGRLISKGERPPDQRSPQIRCVPEGIIPPHYWRYVP